MTKNKLKVILTNLFISSFFFASCVNQDYDLSKNIDLNIHVGGSKLALPVGSTDSIKLNKIIKVDESDVLHLNGGEYSLLKEDVVSPVKVSVNSVAPINVAPINLPIITIGHASAYSELHSASGNLAVAVPLTSGVFELNRSGMPAELSSIKKIGISSAAQVKAVMKFNLTGVNPSADVRFNNLVVTFPDFVVSNQLNANHELILNDKVAGGLTKEIYINGFSFSCESGGALAIKNQLLQLEKNVSIAGNIVGTNLNASMVTGDIKLETSITVSPVVISEVEGMVDPTINVKVNPISFSIPEFLKDEAVTMDVENPMIRLTVNNEIDIPIIISGVLRGYRNGVALSQVDIKGTSVNPIRIDAAGKSVICLSRTGQGGPAGCKNYQIADLNKLIEKIPDKIGLVLNADADQSSTHKIQLGKDYYVNIDYAVEVPFKFGSGLSIAYNDTIDGFNDDIKDLDISSLNVTTTVENNIPLKLQMEAIPVGIDKKTISGLSVKVTGEIAPCDNNGKTQKSPITIELTEASDEAIKKLDGLLLKVTAKSPQTVNGMPLKESQYLRLTNIKAMAIGGLNLDLNKK
ncbi:hypothetical protein [Bacteroides sedimenti]|uniref:Uncharacterized protein n=1 Tax=Bacteroides sedimenti TaxID=2136147 RepID=A0ABN6ZA47_9BACE